MKVFRSDGRLKVDPTIITGASPLAVSAGTQSASSGTVVFSNSNNITFGMTNNSIVTASYSANISAYATSNTTQSSTGVLSTNSIIFAGAGGVSVGISNGSVVISGGAGGGGAVVSNAIQSVGSATGSGTNTSHFAADDHVHAGVFSMGVSNVGNTSGDTRVDVGRYVLQGGNNVTLSQITAANALNTIVISAGAGGGGGDLTAYATSNTTQSSTGVLSTASLIFAGQQGASVGISNGSVVVAAGSRVTFIASGGTITSLGLWSTTGVEPFSALKFVGDGIVSVGILAGDMWISTPNIRAGAGDPLPVGSTADTGTNDDHWARQDHVHAGVFSVGVSTGGNTVGNTRVGFGRFVLQGGNNVTLSQITAANALNTIVVSGPATAAETPFGVSAGTQSVSTGTMVFANSNNITFGMSNSNQITASFSTLPETPFGISAGTQSASTGTMVFSNSNNFTFGMSGSSRITASYTTPVVSNAIASVGSATNSGTATSQFAAHDHVHAGVFSVGVSTGGNTIGDTRVGAGQFVLQGGNNVTLSQITAVGALNTIIVSAAAGGGGNLTAYATSNTTQSSTGVLSTASLIFAGAGIASVGISNGSVVISVPSGGGGGMGISAGTQSVSTGTMVFANSNGVTFGMSLSNQITASYTRNVAGAGILAVGSATGSGTATSQFAAHDHVHEGVFSMGVSTGGNTSNNTRVGAGRFVLQGGVNVTLSQVTAAGALNTIVFQGGLGGGADGVVSVGMSTEGNTAGTTGTVSSGRMIFVGTGPISLSQSLNGQSISLSIGGPATSSLSATGAFSISINGSTISMGVASAPLYTFAPHGVPQQTVGLSANSNTSGSISLIPFVIPNYVSASMLNMHVSMSFLTVGTSSGWQSVSIFHALYSQVTGTGSTNMSVLTSHSFSIGVTGNNSTYSINQPTSSNSAGYTTGSTTSAGTNIITNYVSNKLMQIPIASQLTPGQYWLGIMQLRSTSSVNVGIGMTYYGAILSSAIVSAFAPIGSASSAYSTGTVQALRLGGPSPYAPGFFSSAGLNSIPPSIAMSKVTFSGSILPNMLFWADKT